MALRTSRQIPIPFQATPAFLIFMYITTIMPITTNGFSMRLIPIDSIDSIHFPKNLTLEGKHYRLVEMSKARVLHLRSKQSASTTNSTEALMEPGLNAIQPSLILSLSYYISRFQIGSQLYSPYLLVDSGSRLTWVQCDKCINCFPVRGGNFKYYNSSSFHTLPCSHPLCVPKICRQGICHFEIKYMDASIKGLLATETFTFSGINRTSQTLRNIVFGGGFDNQNVSFGDNDGPNNVIAGVFGLGAGPRSILSQLRNHTKMRFSYCLQSVNAASGTYTLLRFGDDANFREELRRRVQNTSLVPRIELYYVNLLSISVERKRLHIDPALFRLKPDLTGGFAVDSGSPCSFLIEPAYRILREEMVQYFQERYGWRPMQSRRRPYDLCYISQGRNYTLPSMTYHFEGASLLLDQSRNFINLQDRFCLVILPSSVRGPSMLGAFQQANYRFLFDVDAGKMSFVSDNCSYN